MEYFDFKLKCKICNSEIEDISISSDVSYRIDFGINTKVDPISPIVMHQYDKEYFKGIVKQIIFKCPKCGERTINNMDDPNINNFVRDGFIRCNDIKHKSYGDLLMVDSNCMEKLREPVFDVINVLLEDLSELKFSDNDKTVCYISGVKLNPNKFEDKLKSIGFDKPTNLTWPDNDGQYVMMKSPCYICTYVPYNQTIDIGYYS